MNIWKDYINFNYSLSYYIILKIACVVSNFYRLNFAIIFSQIMHESNAMKKRLKRRPKKIKFAVGMIVSLKYHDYCDYEGVIIGWDHDCHRIEFLFKMEYNIMCPYLGESNRYYSCKCEPFSASAHQPHYIILLENNDIHYVPQGMIISCFLINHICFMFICVLYDLLFKQCNIHTSFLL